MGEEDIYGDRKTERVRDRKGAYEKSEYRIAKIVGEFFMRRYIS